MASVFCPLYVFIAYMYITGVLLDNVADNTACRHGDTVYLLGSQWTIPGYCRWFLCEENNQVIEKRCLDFELKEGCYMSEYDSSQNYPDCCPKLNCPDQTSIILQDWVNH